MRIAYIDGPRLRRALLAGCEFAQGTRAELNRINVFPVPDGDTGTNLALTARAIAERLRDNADRGAGAVAAAAAEAGVLGARGNCGMILSHFLLGFAQAVGDRWRLSVAEFATALRDAVAHLYGALERPVEGTIITVMREVAEEAESASGDARHDFAALIETLLERARAALARTPELLPALKQAGVVDAGAKGFVGLLDGIVRLVHGEPIAVLRAEAEAEGEAGAEEPFAAAAVDYPSESEPYRYCTEALVRGETLPSSDEVRGALRQRGGSLIVIRAGGVLKVHVHTDEPEAVFDYLRGLGELAAHKAEDMTAQHAAVERASAAHVELARRPVVVLADTACDLPEDVVQAHGMVLVPLLLVFEDEELDDRTQITAAEFARRLQDGAHPSTSQPSPQAFLDGFRRAGQDGEAVVAVLLGSSLSGTLASAEAAAKKVDGLPVHVADSRGASLLQGLLALKAAELAEAAVPPEEIVRRLAAIRERSGLMFTVEGFDRLIASGRVTRAQAFFGNMLGIRPILALEPDGTVVAAARVRAGPGVLPRMVELLRERIPDGARVRFGVIHVARPEIVGEATAALEQAFGRRETLVAPASPVLATHIGPGAWGIAYMVES